MQKLTQTDTLLLRLTKFLTIIFVLIRLLPSASEAASTGTLTLQGVVPNVTSITVTPVSGYNTLDFSVTQTNLVVAQVTEENNTSVGYAVTVSSLNGGALKNGSSSIPYTARYGGSGFSLTALGTQVTNVSSQASVVSTAKNLDISYTGAPHSQRVSGTYSDTLTFTIQGN
jgi:hypothetical protein